LSPTRESKLAEVLARTTMLRVVRAQDGDELARDHVYVLPEYFDIVMSSRTQLALTAPLPRPRKTIDRFFCSLAEQRGHESVGIVLSGTGTDGTKGLEAIRLARGRTFVQSPSSALFSSMPESASLYADHCAAPAELGDLLMQHLHANDCQGRR
jgi:two-component system CheB/CheR fusion protein